MTKIDFPVFPGLDFGILKIHDFPGFPGPVRTLKVVLALANPLSTLIIEPTKAGCLMSPRSSGKLGWPSSHVKQETYRKSV